MAVSGEVQDKAICTLCMVSICRYHLIDYDRLLAALIEAHLPDAQLAYWHEPGQRPGSETMPDGSEGLPLQERKTEWARQR